MGVRVCIPVAGTGSRLGGKTRFINKALVTVGDRPAISHLIEQFPHDTDFVFALGYKGYLIREFLALAYPQRRFLFADVDIYEGPESGLGLSLLKCEHLLQQPFIFISCDTLVKETIPGVEHNWMGYADTNDASQYRSLEVHGNVINAICEKGSAVSFAKKPYIGLAGIKDYREFWQAMHSGGSTAIEQGEAYGLRHLMGSGIHGYAFTWYDTGSPAALEKTRSAYRVPDQPTILEKENEAIWFVGNDVIKFCGDERFISNRVKRAVELKFYVPEITGAQAHMYRYTKAQGQVLSEVITVPLFKKLLAHCQEFWKPANLDSEEQHQFKTHCLNFYRHKTFERVKQFFEISGKQDRAEVINGISVPGVHSMLEALDWEGLAQGMPGAFHGDLHFENIVWNEADQRFIFLDWRQDFDGLLPIGDRYYDLAKLLHGLIINHGLIAQERFEVQWDEAQIRFAFDRTPILTECENFFYDWLADNNYDVGKVRLLTALIYLNIAPLHHKPYSFLLYALGRSILFRCLPK